MASFRLAADGSWKQDPLKLATGKTESDFVGYSDSTLVTDNSFIKVTTKPEWLPEMVWDMAAKIFGFQGMQHRLRFWDVETGDMLQEFSFFESAVLQDGRLNARSFVSEDSKWLAVANGNEMTVYNVTGRRTVWCWVVVVGLVLLAVWICWPRRIGLRQS